MGSKGNTCLKKLRMSSSRAMLHPYFYESPMPKPPDQIRALLKLEHYQSMVRKYVEAKKLKKLKE